MGLFATSRLDCLLNYFFCLSKYYLSAQLGIFMQICLYSHSPDGYANGRSCRTPAGNNPCPCSGAWHNVPLVPAGWQCPAQRCGRRGGRAQAWAALALLTHTCRPLGQACCLLTTTVSSDCPSHSDCCIQGRPEGSLGPFLLPARAVGLGYGDFSAKGVDLDWLHFQGSERGKGLTLRVHLHCTKTLHQPVSAPGLETWDHAMALNVAT